MENNCLVTKLKVSVDNSNLHKLGILTYKYSTAPTSGNLQVTYNSNVVTPIQAKAFDAQGNLLGTSYTTENPKKIRLDYNLISNISYIEIYDIYNIKEIVTNQGVPDNIPSCLSLVSFDETWYNGVDFDILDFSDSLEIIKVNGTKIKGNTSNLSKFRNITRLDIQYVTTFSGSVEEFGEILLNDYTQDKDVLLNIANNLTFHNTKVADPTTYTISVASSQVTVKVGNVTKATYDGTTWTYNS